MTTSFSEIASFAKSELNAIVDEQAPDFKISGVAASAKLQSGKLAFAKAIDDELLGQVQSLKQVALLVPLDTECNDPHFIRADNPRLAFAQITERFFAPKYKRGIHPSAIIDESAEIDPSASIGPYCLVGSDCKIGARTILTSHVTLARNVDIGEDCMLWSHCVLGEDGFGIERSSGALQSRIPHLGGVVLGDGVHIGNMTAVVAGTIEPTQIGDGTMIDNLVHIAHNCQIGRNCQVIACAEVSGSVTIEDNATIGPNSSVIQKVSVGANSIAGIGTVIIKSVPENVVVAGVPGRILRGISDEGTSR